MFKVFINNENNAITLISESNHDYSFFKDTQEDIFSGQRRKCIKFIEDYQEENGIPDDEFIFQEIYC